MTKYVRAGVILTFLVGFLIGVVPPTSAVAQTSFAGYGRDTTVKGSRANIGFVNPPIVSASFEWVMVGDGTGQHWFQAGWIKRNGLASPKYFAERGCPPSTCRFEFEDAPSDRAPLYEVTYLFDPNNGGDNWLAVIDGFSKLQSDDRLVGLGSSTSHAYWSGETHDTNDQLGGTLASHLRLSNAEFKDSGGTWVTPADSLLVDITTAGTRYRASKGVSGISEWVDNWTE